MTDPVAVFVDRWGTLASQVSLPDDERWQALREAAVTAFNDLGADSLRLFNAVGLENRDAYQIVAEAFDTYRECPLPEPGDQRYGFLGLVAAFITHENASSELPRRLQIDEWMPSLPNLAPPVLFADCLLSYEEATNPAAVSLIHRAFRQSAHDEISESVLASVGSGSAPSAFDRLARPDGRKRSLRFIPFYFQPSQREFFAGEVERTDWQRRASAAASSRADPNLETIDLSAPMTYCDALWGTLTAQTTITIEMLLDSARGQRSEAAREVTTPNYLLIEPIGLQALDMATSFRLSMVRRDNGGSPLASHFEFNWRRMWGPWRQVAGLISGVAAREFGLHTLMAPMPQELGAVFMDTGRPRVLVVLGPCIAVEPAEPDTISIESANAPDHEHAKWWDFERQSTEVASKAVAQVFAASAGCEAERVRVFSSFVIRQNGWRPAFTAYFEAGRSDESVAGIGIENDELRAAARTLAFLLARKWVFVQPSGDSGFLCS